MDTRILVRRVLPMIACAGLALTGAAQGPGGAAGAGGAAQPAATAVLFDPSAAEAVMERARRAYGELKSYRDTAKLRFVLRARDAEGKEYAEDDTEELSFTFGGARKFVFEQKHFTIHSDGATQTAREIAEDPGTPSRYVQRPAEDGIAAEAKTPDIELVCAVHAPANLLMAPARFAKEFPVFTQVTGMTPEMLGDKVGVRLSGKGWIPSLAQDQTIPVTAWFSSDTGLVQEMVLDLSSAYQDLGEGVTVERAVAVISFADIAVNQPVADDRFVFKPGESDEKVETLIVPEESDPQQDLVGLPAPEFNATDLDGKAVTHADLKGKAAVLVFWSVTWAPSVDLLADAQEIAGAYADKGVLVLGVNQDVEDDAAAVKKAVADRKIGLRQLTDTKGDLALKFWVESVPCTAVIDAQGIVRWIHTGGAPGLKKEIARAIDAALAPPPPPPPAPSPPPPPRDPPATPTPPGKPGK